MSERSLLMEKLDRKIKYITIQVTIMLTETIRIVLES